MGKFSYSNFVIILQNRGPCKQHGGRRIMRIKSLLLAVRQCWLGLQANEAVAKHGCKFGDGKLLSPAFTQQGTSATWRLDHQIYSSDQPTKALPKTGPQPDRVTAAAGQCFTAQAGFGRPPRGISLGRTSTGEWCNSPAWGQDARYASVPVLSVM